MNRRIGFIGAGLMAEALIGGLLQSGVVVPGDVMASDIGRERLREVHGRYGIQVTEHNPDVINHGDVVILAVKPQHASDVLEEIGPLLTPNHLVVSIMAGVSIDRIASYCASGVRIVRCMPNVACLVKQSATALALGRHATSDDEESVRRIFDTVGRVVTVEERLMDTVTGLSGSGPAYAMMVIESLADGGVAEGLPRQTALMLAAQTLLGAATMVLSTGEHPAVIRERVTSAAGTTVEGLAVLEERATRSAFADAVRAATRRSRQLGKEM